MITLKVRGHYDKHKSGYIKFKGYLSKRNLENVKKRLQIIPGDYLVLEPDQREVSITIYNQRGEPVDILD